MPAGAILGTSRSVSTSPSGTASPAGASAGGALGAPVLVELGDAGGTDSPPFPNSVSFQRQAPNASTASTRMVRKNFPRAFMLFASRVRRVRRSRESTGREPGGRATFARKRGDPAAV